MEKNTIEQLNKNECCGCGSCMQKCPKKAISLQENKEGFLYPVIDKEKCINCGLCARACAQLKKATEKKDTYPKAYAMYNKNNKEIQESTSGGIFSVVANYILEQNGVVFGAAYDKDLNVQHIKIEDKKDLHKLRGSKYVQSNIGHTFKEAEQELKNKKHVLFTGTPCQIANLKSFLGKDYENLVTCDIVCHGVPSQKLFQKYLGYLSKKYKSKVIKYNFRTKEKKGWGLVSKVETEDGKKRFIEPELDPYYSNFLESTIYRESCYNCHYTSYNRVSDITLADYWGVMEIHPEFYSEKGCSLILINSNKGELIKEKVAEKIAFIETDLDYAAIINKNLKQQSPRKDIRKIIYNNIDSTDDYNYIKKNLKTKITLRTIIKYITPTIVKRYRKKIQKFLSLKLNKKNNNKAV